jgi:hypothetical protein
VTSLEEIRVQSGAASDLSGNLYFLLVDDLILGNAELQLAAEAVKLRARSA